MEIRMINRTYLVILMIVIIISSTLLYLRSEISNEAFKEHSKILSIVNTTLENISDILHEQDRQRKLANITTSEFVESFNNLVRENHEVLVTLNKTDISDSQLRTIVSMLQLDSAGMIENQRTMFKYLDDHRELLENHTRILENISRQIEN